MCHKPLIKTRVVAKQQVPALWTCCFAMRAGFVALFAELFCFPCKVGFCFPWSNVCFVFLIELYSSEVWGPVYYSLTGPLLRGFLHFSVDALSDVSRQSLRPLSLQTSVPAPSDLKLCSARFHSYIMFGVSLTQLLVYIYIRTWLIVHYSPLL